MKILALEASAKAASAAICTEKELVGESFLATGKTHSQTLLPLAGELLKITDTDIKSLDGIAVTKGPGSFTGLRIALAAVKGMAMGADIGCIGVSTLEALAYNLLGREATVCAVMDARCGQVYTARFKVSEDSVERLTEDCAVSIEDLGEEIKNIGENVIFVGDGAELCYNKLSETLKNVRMAPMALRLQRAASVAQCAIKKAAAEGFMSAESLVPTYLRLPQAERELLAKSKK